MILQETSLQLFHIHLDTRDHFLPLSDFHKLTRSTELIASDLSASIFNQDMGLEVFVAPPESGSFHIKIGFKTTVALAVGGTIWTFITSDIGNSYIKGLTDHEANHWAEWAGKETSELVKKVRENEIIDPDKTLTDKIISECTKGFLSASAGKLEQIGLNSGHFREAHIAKNKFYGTCIENNEIRGLGFSSAHKFPIKRSDFPKKISKIPEKPNNEKKPEWVIETRDIIIPSPVWIRDGRKWQANYTVNQNQKTTSVTIEDDTFWNFVDLKRIKPQIFDNMEVQWAYLPDGNKQKNTKILRVLSFNSMPISKKLSKRELTEILENFSHSDRDDPGLFD